MKDTVSHQAIEYLNYLKEQGISHVPRTVKRQAPPPRPQPASRSTAAQSPPHTPGQMPPNGADALPKPALSIPAALQPIANEIAACHRCPLAATRTYTVPGQGPLQPDILFVGEGPGADEDAQGIAFIGRAGKLLTKMITAMGYTREEVFLGNIVKCRPPGNRAPTREEMADCIPYLKQQIAIIQPKTIICMGATAARGLVQETLPIGKARGHWREFEGIPVMLTFHPAYLLRDPRKKKDCWADLKAVLTRLDKAPPK
ncbi:MAG: uracil-DNA glycosylase [Kiritimatiellae bacterium]|nr:uracil-DNA glycosylase [Kiritimatiellia bacterium]